jgi:hypothetical protein
LVVVGAVPCRVSVLVLVLLVLVLVLSYLWTVDIFVAVLLPRLRETLEASNHVLFVLVANSKYKDTSSSVKSM